MTAASRMRFQFWSWRNTHKRTTDHLRHMDTIYIYIFIYAVHEPVQSDKQVTLYIYIYIWYALTLRIAYSYMSALCRLIVAHTMEWNGNQIDGCLSCCVPSDETSDTEQWLKNEKQKKYISRLVVCPRLCVCVSSFQSNKTDIIHHMVVTLRSFQGKSDSILVETGCVCMYSIQFADVIFARFCFVGHHSCFLAASAKIATDTRTTREIASRITRQTNNIKFGTWRVE